MMFSYPYFKPPYYNRYSRYGYYYPNTPYYSNTSNNQSIHTKNPYNDTVYTEKVPKPKIEKNETSHKTEDSPLFQIFGIDLYYDDILLVCLIFFLYQEGVKDEGLFIALILLLLS